MSADSPYKINSNFYGHRATWNGAKIIPFFSILALAAIIWNFPVPQGLNNQTWHLFIIFIATVIALITKPLPMGAISIIAMAACLATNTLTTDQTLSGFSSHIVWLVAIAILIARGFIKSGLGSRIAYMFIKLAGKNTIGLAYGLMSTELLLSPFLPSNTARGAGVIYPIISSLCKSYDSSPEQGTQRKIGAYLMSLCFQNNLLTSTMFLTAMAANPLTVKLAADMGFTITWTTWATAAIVPGMISFIVMPLLLFKIAPPEIIHTPEAPKMAEAKLKELGTLKFEEILMLATFGLLLFLWIFGSHFNISATAAAIIGLGVLLFSGVLSWQEVINEHAAWDVFIWLSTMLMLAGFLTEFGMMTWLSHKMQGHLSGFSWITTLTIVVLLNFYIHYLFTSMTAHITSLYVALLLVAVATGAPGMLAVLLLAFTSNLCGGLTHYSTGTAPVYFSAGYVTTKEWWKVGFTIGTVNLLIWSLIGSAWWKFLGLW